MARCGASKTTSARPPPSGRRIARRPRRGGSGSARAARIGPAGAGDRQPVHVARDEPVACEPASSPTTTVRDSGRTAQHVERPRRGQARGPRRWPDREAVDAPVAADLAARPRRRSGRSGPRRGPGARRSARSRRRARSRSPGSRACRRRAGRARGRARRTSAFVEIADGEERGRELLLREAEQEVGLVLAAVRALQQAQAPVAASRSLRA